MKRTQLFWFLVLMLFAAAMISACGSSGGSSPAATTTLTGSVFAAPVSGAAVVVKNAGGAVIAGPVQTGSDGSYSVSLPSSALSSDMRIESTGGTYTDEATQATTTAGAFGAFVSGGTLTTGIVHIDPFTTIMHELITKHSMTFGQARTALSNAFGFIPDHSVASSNTPSNGANTPQRIRAFRAGVLSELTKELGLTPGQQADLIAAIVADLADDGNLNGSAGTVGGSPLGEDLSNLFEHALVTYLSDTTHNLTGVLPGEIGDLAFGKVAFTPTYKIEYLPGMKAPAEGKTAFKIRVTNRVTHSAVTGMAISLMPLMYMDDKKHTSPVDPVTEDAANPGTYNCAAYYLMGSGPDMGFWELKVTIGSGMSGESAKFYPFVSMYMGMGDTPKFNLYGGASDLRSNGMPRFYFLFKDGLTSGMTSTFNLFIAAMDSMMSMPFLTTGTVLTSPTGTYAVSTISLQASLDSSFASAATGSNCGGGHWTIPGISLSSGSTNTVYVRLTVDGDVKTAGTSSTAAQYATFLLTPGMGM